MYLKMGVVCYIVVTLVMAIYKLTAKNESYEAVNFFMNMSVLILIGVITCNTVYGVPW